MATLDNVSIAKPTEAQGYLVAAQGMLTGAQPLEKVQPIPAIALTLLCGHACEAALKALLTQSGMSAAILSRVPHGHDILYLWQSAESNGHPLPSPQPDWVAQLHRVYDRPFQLRYPLGFHGIVLPNQSAMLKGTEGLVSLATSVCKVMPNPRLKTDVENARFSGSLFAMA
jgi:hypothetical protein